MNKSSILWGSYLSLEERCIDIAKHIYITDNPFPGSGVPYQLFCYSPLIADVLLSCCSAIESISKELYFTLNSAKVKKKLYFDYDCIKSLNGSFDLDNKRVLIVSSLIDIADLPEEIMFPLRKVYLSASKNPNGLCSVDIRKNWKEAYNAIKHDRCNNIEAGNVFNLLSAMGALYLLTIYYRRVEFHCSYNQANSLDYSCGSRIFFGSSARGSGRSLEHERNC